MTNKDEVFLKKLLATFKIEAEEHLQLITSGLIELEKTTSEERSKSILESIFREAHSLKGAARAINLMPIETVCKSLESIFDLLKRNKIALHQESFTHIHHAIDFITKILSAIGTVNDLNAKHDFYEGQNELLKSLDEIRKQETDLESDSKSSSSNAEAIRDAHFKSDSQLLDKDFKSTLSSSDTVRIPSKKLEGLFRRAEELFTSKLSTGDIVTEMQTLHDTLGKWEHERSALSPALREIQKELKVATLKNGKSNNGMKNISDMLEYITWSDSHLKSIERNLASQIVTAKKNYHNIDLMTTEFFDEMKNVLMLPFSTMLEIFPKLVRDLSNAQGKDIELLVKGTDIEIDRRILEELKDPFIHLIRNCIDHGIETNEIRRQRNKNIPGIIRITISQKESDKVEIAIGDDGNGIDLEKVLESSVRLRIISQEESANLTARQIVNLIFSSGVSSSQMITDISGRGLGLAIVKEKVEKLGGTVTVETEKNAGTNFKIVVPHTLATFHGVFVSVDNNIFILPSSNVTQVFKITKDRIKSVENRATVQTGEEILSLVKMADALGIKRKNNIDEELQKEFQIVVVSDGNDKIAYQVDEIIGEREVLVKQLSKPLMQLKNIFGTTILGNGKVVPILNIYDLLKNSVSRSIPFTLNKLSVEEETRRKSILVAEDSITARTLLKNILETAGYDVTTAVDGIDAFTQLKMKNFNIVVSDVDMPRMSGFDLTIKIRTTKDYSELPVVLVTALESREDRERGIDVGANAYIVKSSFDQKNLLEVIRQLT